jgi:hypothetical protein
MNSDNYTFIAVCIAACICFGFFSSCAAKINAADDAAVVEMVKAGANPVAASCSVGREGHETCAAVGAHANQAK